MSRWWAPEGAHLGPDETDLAMLTPGTDKRLDLGQFLLTMHRIGAAACEEAASGPIPDESSLVSTLASARRLYAPPVVEAVSKSVGDRHYADLLVRDLADDAEYGALQVFRTAVTSGVPAPLAAQRAGMVFGVAPDDLGPFLAVAKEMRAHPAALSDAADRVLFTAVQKAVDEEMDNLEVPFEEVSKAPAVLERTGVATPDVRATPYYDARDVRGRFAPAVPVAERLRQLQEQRELGTVREAKTPTRVKRTQRVKRVQRAKQEQQALPEVRLKAAEIKAAGVRQARLTPQQVKNLQVRAVDAPTAYGEWSEDLMKELPDRGDYTRLVDLPEHRFVMSNVDYRQFLDRQGGSIRNFRIGHVINKTGGQPHMRGEHKESVARVADAVRGNMAAPDYRKITPEDRAKAHWEGGSAAEKALKEIAARDMAAEHVAHHLGIPEETPAWGHAMENTMGEILDLEHYDEEGNLYLVLRREDAEDARLVEFKIDDAYNVRGTPDEPSGPNFGLDPNQVYYVSRAEPDVVYYPDTGAISTVFTIKPIDPDFEAEFNKAALLTRDDVQTPYFDARDVRGRFAVAPAAIQERLQQAQAAPSKITRTQRVKRVQRTAQPKTETLAQTRIKQQPVTQQRLQAANLKVAQAQAQALKTAAPPKGKSGPGYYELKAQHSYTLINQDELAEHVGGFDGPLTKGALAFILEHSQYGKDVHVDLFDRADEMDEGKPEWEKIRSPYPVTMLNEVVMDADQLTFTVDEHAVETNSQALRALASAFFEENPDAETVRLQKEGTDQPVTVYRDLRDFSSFTKAEPFILIEQDTDADLDRPMVLVPMLETSKNRLIPTEGVTSWGEMDSPDFGFHEESGPVVASTPAIARNPKVRMYLLTNA